MDPISLLVDFILHLDKNLDIMIQSYGIWTYVILFVIVFCETGLVAFPFLPGDSLIFAASALTVSLGSFNMFWLWVVFVTAAFVGDTANYWIGYYIGPKIFTKENVRFLKKEYLDRAHIFYEKHGGKTIVLARFIPIIRTFAPFVAGIGKMNYFKFMVYNISGGIVWVSLFLGAGYFFGNVPIVKDNFTLVVLAIIIITLIPPFAEFYRHWRKKRPTQS
ncbi:MAG: DedA family protein [Thermoplasmata archaeon]